MRRPAALVLTLAASATLTLGLASPATAAAAPVQPVAKVDLARYVGQWYQLAAIPASFEAQCAKNVTATYTANANGTIGVKNVCRTYLPINSTVYGTARVENAPANSALNVSFVNFFGKPLYGKDANYLIFGLDPGYRWALVGSADHKTGFVLSRTVTLSGADQATIKRTIVTNGFDLCAFEITRQDGGAQQRTTLCRAPGAWSQRVKPGDGE